MSENDKDKPKITKKTSKTAKKTKKKARRSAKSTKMVDKSHEKIKELLGDCIKDEDFEVQIQRTGPGRPTKYNKKIHPQALEILMGQGLSFEASCAQMGIHSDTGQEWAKKHDEFSVSKKRGEQLSRLWWERAGMKGMYWGKDFNATVWVFAMKNRHNWKDNKDLNLGGQPGNPINAHGPLGAILDELDGMDDESLDREFEKLMARKRTK